MASITGFATPEIFGAVTLGNTIANVDFAVGSGMQNDRGDVQLVQLLLSNALAVADKLHVPMKDDFGNIIVNRGVSIDGIFGTETGKLLRAFQRQVKFLTSAKKLVTAKEAIRADGIVNKSNATGVSTISNTIYTIVYLNIAFISFNERPFDKTDTDGVQPLTNQLNVIELD